MKAHLWDESTELQGPYKHDITQENIMLMNQLSVIENVFGQVICY